MLDLLGPWVEETRRQIFEGPQAPFRSLNGAAAWIEQQAAAQPRASKTDLALAADLDRQIMALARQLSSLTLRQYGVTQHVDTLAYQKPGKEKEWVHQAVVLDTPSALGVLQKAASTMAATTGFTEDAVVRFILTGALPQLPSARVHVGPRSHKLPDGTWWVRGHATIELNVRDVSFRQLRAIHRQVRSAWGPIDRGLTKQENKLLAIVTATGPPPHGSGAGAYWKRVHTKARAAGFGGETYNAVQMAYYRAKDKLDEKTDPHPAGLLRALSA